MNNIIAESHPELDSESNIDKADIAIKVENLTKTYKLYDSPTDRLKEALHWRGKKYHKDFHALNDVSFEIKKGETVGIIGKNGSGKSTLLKIITGVLSPTSGTVQVSGKVSALLELGSGFNPEYTGLENVYFQGSLMGYSEQEMGHRIDSILRFADIGDFICQPFKSYSSGMAARLAFAVSINVEPDILIVDEALSVGDFQFQQKCLRKIHEFVESGKTVLFVSHDTTSLKLFCDKGILLKDGNLIQEGDIVEVCDYYFESSVGAIAADKMVVTTYNTLNNKVVLNAVSTNKLYGDGKAIITEVGVLNQTNNIVQQVSQGGVVKIIIRFKALKDIFGVLVGIMFKDEKGMGVFGINTHLTDPNRIIDAEKNKTYEFELSFIVPNLSNRTYGLTAAVQSGNTEIGYTNHCWGDGLSEINVYSNNKRFATGMAICLDPESTLVNEVREI